MGRKKISEKDPNSVVVNLNLKLNDANIKNAKIAKLLRDGDFVDERKIIHLKGKDLTLYLLAARVKELEDNNRQQESIITKKEEVIDSSIPQQNQMKLKNFGIKTN